MQMTKQLEFPSAESIEDVSAILVKVSADLTKVLDSKRSILAAMHSAGKCLLNLKADDPQGFRIRIESALPTNSIKSAEASMRIAKNLSPKDIEQLSPTAIDRKVQGLLSFPDEPQEPKLPAPPPSPTAFMSNYHRWRSSIVHRYGDLDKLPAIELQQLRSLLRPAYEDMRRLMEPGQ